MTTSTQPSILSSVLTFIGSFIVMVIIINIVLWAMAKYAGMGTESGAGMGFLPVILGAMMAGQRYGKLAGAKPTAGYSWTASFCFAVVTLASIALILFATASLLGPQFALPPLSDVIDEMGMGLFFGVFAGFFLLIWVLQRFIFSFGAGQSVKLAERAAAKANS
jgi:hypothetical protein